MFYFNDMTIRSLFSSFLCGKDYNDLNSSFIECNPTVKTKI